MSGPRRNANELFEFVYGRPMQELADAEGRYLGEHIAAKYDDGEDAQLVFRDPRDQTGLVANVGALHQVTGAWATVLHLLSPAADSPSLIQMLDATRMPLALIARRWLRGQSVPPALAAAYKASVGYGQILRTWLLRGAPTEAPELHPFLAFIDAEGWLIGKDYVCPGSRRAIAEGWVVLCGDSPSDFVEEPPTFVNEAQDAALLRDALSCFEGLFFALYSHERSVGSLPSVPMSGVVFQLAPYVSGYRPEDSMRLSADSRVADFVRELTPSVDARARFARHASALLAPFAGQDVALDPSLYERLFERRVVD
ncbi:MAG: hypothetical protein AB8H86_10540 [Polyangiales bacterium]